MSLGPLEIILIIVVIALVFGARKLPELGKGMGRGIKEFKQEIRDDRDHRDHHDHHDHHDQRDQITDVPSRQLDPVSGAPVAPVSRERTVENPNERHS